VKAFWMRRIGIVVGLIAVLSVAAILIGVFLPDTPPPPGAPAGQELYARFCASCHGRSGRGSWNATLSLIRPGNLADRSRMQGLTDQYLADLVKHGGAPIGKPGMPAFGFHLTDDEIRELVTYVRTLSAAR
jgi:mono/diheme cytochrome c family protein